MRRRFASGGAMSCRMASKTYLELGVILLFQSVELASQFRMRGKHLAQTDKGAHDLNVDQNGAPAPQDAGKHRHTLLGEGVGQMPPTAPTGT